MEKFKIPSTPPTTSKSIRFPNDVIEAIEKAIEGKECTFICFRGGNCKGRFTDFRGKQFSLAEARMFFFKKHIVLVHTVMMQKVRPHASRGFST